MTDIPTNRVTEVVMQQFKCVSFLLRMAILLATLESLVTNAHRELLMVTNSERQLQTKLPTTKLLTVEETKSEEIRTNVMAGQKMVFGDVVMQKMEAEDARSKPGPAAIHSDGKCGHGERKDLSMNCYFTSKKPRRGVDFDGRIPFSADYHLPHNHPPKNN